MSTLTITAPCSGSSDRTYARDPSNPSSSMSKKTTCTTPCKSTSPEGLGHAQQHEHAGRVVDKPVAERAVVQPVGVEVSPRRRSAADRRRG